MPPTVRFPIVLVLVALFSSVTGAPGFVRAKKAGPAKQVIEQIERLLASGTPSDRAWAAHLCAKHDARSLLPQLVERLVPEPGNNGNVAANQAILDALIRLDGTAPAERLVPLLPLHSDEVVILMAREPAKNRAALLSSMKTGRVQIFSQLVFLYGVLMHHRSPGLAALLLDRPMSIVIGVYDDPADLPKFYANVLISDDDPEGLPKFISGGTPAGELIPPRPRLSLPKTFPPVTRYALTGMHPPRSDFDTAIGHSFVQVYLETKTVEPGTVTGIYAPDNWFFPREGPFLVGLLRRKCLAPAELFPRLNLPAVCTDPADLPHLVEERRRLAADTFNELKQRLLDAGLLTRQEFDALAPRIESVRIFDHRKNKTGPLPAIPQTESQ